MNYDQKPARAFDTIALLLDIPAGTVLNDSDVRNGCFVVHPDGTYNETGDQFVWMVFHGHIRHTHLDTVSSCHGDYIFVPGCHVDLARACDWQATNL